MRNKAAVTAAALDWHWMAGLQRPNKHFSEKSQCEGGLVAWHRIKGPFNSAATYRPLQSPRVAKKLVDVFGPIRSTIIRYIEIEMYPSSHSRNDLCVSPSL